MSASRLRAPGALLASALALVSAACAGRSSSGGTVSSTPPAAAKTRGGRVEPVPGTPLPLSPSDDCPRASVAFAQPIAVVEDLGLARHPPVLSFPIAFSREAGVTSLTGFTATTLEGEPLPTQLEVLSRWGGAPSECEAPIRWAHAHVLARVEPGTRAYLALRHDPAEASARGPALRVEEGAGSIQVDTGPARFTLDTRRFVGLSKVELRTGAGFEVLSQVGTAGGAGLLVDRGGERISTATGEVARVEVERRGPAVATIAVHGEYAGKKGERVFRATTRLSFYAGTGVVLFDHTYYNGETADFTAHGGKNRKRVDRVYLRLPVDLGPSPEVVVRGAERVFRVRPKAQISVAQDKRTPDRAAVVYSVREGEATLEVGTFADHPLIAAIGGGRYAAATLGSMSVRDPQALRYDPSGGALEVDFQSEAMFIGGARGIWSKAVLDFGPATPDLDILERGHALYAHATRPLIAAPSMAYLNATRVRGALPTGELPGEFASFDARVDAIHDGTAQFLRRNRITGSQLWPDLPRRACEGGACPELESGYFEGGDCNYWDWSLVELEAFLRTADPSFLHDFALPEAITMAETVSFRPDRYERPQDSAKKAPESSFAGFSPCYGGGRGDDGTWLEGLNHRIGACPGDYSYNKVHQLAYVLTGDRRFTDFFVHGAETAARLYKDPTRSKPNTWLELSASRTAYQYLELLLDAGEFARAPEENRRFRERARSYFDHMRTTSLERGHTCNLLGSGLDDPKVAGSCQSDQAWMLPVWAEWVARLYRLEAHLPARDWLVELGKMSAARYTVLDDEGRPDFSEREGTPGWRTTYRCLATRSGVRDDTCEKFTQIENEGRFYANGLIAFLNVFGLVLDADPSDPLRICSWLPSAYAQALEALEREGQEPVWGKALGQAYAFTQTTLGALVRCAP